MRKTTGMATDYDAPKITDSDEPGHLPRTAHRQRKGTQPPHRGRQGHRHRRILRTLPAPTCPAKNSPTASSRNRPTDSPELLPRPPPQPPRRARAADLPGLRLRTPNIRGSHLRALETWCTPTGVTYWTASHHHRSVTDRQPGVSPSGWQPTSQPSEGNGSGANQSAGLTTLTGAEPSQFLAASSKAANISVTPVPPPTSPISTARC
jgi:hypothetical protein